VSDDNKFVVSRIQVRRGLKQDLPQPLRPAEIGFTTDSRQVYIGADTEDPASAQFNSVSFYENTLLAKETTASVTSNQIIYFTVPFIKYSKGEFDGISTIKQWVPTDAKSIISSTQKPESRFHSADFPVFSADVTSAINSTVYANTTSTVILVDSIAGSDPTGNIRVGDTLSTGEVVNAINRANSDVYAVTLNTAVTLTANANLSFVPRSIINYKTGSAFISSDVHVHKSGIKLIAEEDADLVIRPSAVSDFVLDGRQTSSTGSHTLTLRTRPAPSDDITLAYYTASDVVQALVGVNGKITGSLNIDSFYSAYNIPEYRQISPESVRVSETTGLGFIGLQGRHIAASADGVAINNPEALSLGDFLISRNDWAFGLTGSIDRQGSAEDGQYQITFNVQGQNILSAVTDTDAYAYNRVQLKNTSNTSLFFNDALFDVNSANAANAIINLIPNDFTLERPVSANVVSLPAISSNVVISLSGDTEGVRENDYVRIIDENLSNINNQIFLVRDVNADRIIVDTGNVVTANVGVVVNSNVSSASYINHGPGETNIDVNFQVITSNNSLSPTGIDSEVSDIIVTQASGMFGINVSYSISSLTSDITDNTFFLLNYPGSLVDFASLDITGQWIPELQTTYTSAGFTATPVLAIDLSGNTSVRQAIASINNNSVSIPAVSSSEQDLFVEVNELPTSDNTTAIYVTQDPGYSSVDVGGIEFSLFNDANDTLTTLGLTAGEYTRDNATVRAKLERWMHTVSQSRDFNLFTTIMNTGTSYANSSLVPNFQTYSLTEDDTFDEIYFGSREEAADFNYIVNSSYSSLIYNRNADNFDGSRGLVNLRNNIELITRDSSEILPRRQTYVDLEEVEILVTDDDTTNIVVLDVDDINAFIIEYSINDFGEALEKYSRVGTMHLSGRADFNTLDAVIINDTFSSQYEEIPASPLIEPLFEPVLENNKIIFRMKLQTAGSFTGVHNLGIPLRMRYALRRWVG